MAEFSFETIKKFLLKSIANGIEAELSLYLNGKEYMIIIYGDRCSFQRCGINDRSGEHYFKSLDELYRAQQIDGIVPERDWDKIEKIASWDIEIHN